jgi:hypothetical protein
MNHRDLSKVPINKSGQLKEKLAQCLLVCGIIIQTQGMLFPHSVSVHIKFLYFRKQDKIQYSAVADRAKNTLKK